MVIVAAAIEESIVRKQIICLANYGFLEFGGSAEAFFVMAAFAPVVLRI